jgi:hypothetical protein
VRTLREKQEATVQKQKSKIIKYETEKVLAAIKNKKADTLQNLHSEYSARMRYGGAMIWQIGSIFIPLSLSGIILGLDNFPRVLAVGCFSVFLIWVWYFLSETIDNSLERDLAICGAIETALLSLEEKPLKRGLNDLIKQSDKIKVLRLRTIRLLLPILITLGWVGVVVLAYFITR